MANGYESRVLICEECNQEFVFTVAAQEYFAERGYTDDPRRCKSCYTQFKKAQRGAKPQPGVDRDRLERPYDIPQ